MRWSNIWTTLALNIDLDVIRRKNQTVIWDELLHLLSCCCCYCYCQPMLFIDLCYCCCSCCYFCHRNQYFDVTRSVFHFSTLFFFCSVPFAWRLFRNNSQRLWESEKSVSINVWWLWLCKVLFEIWPLYICWTWEKRLQTESHRSTTILWEGLFIGRWWKLFECRLIACITKNERSTQFFKGDTDWFIDFKENRNKIHKMKTASRVWNT